jgi:hypothetical protein
VGLVTDNLGLIWAAIALAAGGLGALFVVTRRNPSGG